MRHSNPRHVMCIWKWCYHAINNSFSFSRPRYSSSSTRFASASLMAEAKVKWRKKLHIFFFAVHHARFLITFATLECFQWEAFISCLAVDNIMRSSGILQKQLKFYCWKFPILFGAPQETQHAQHNTSHHPPPDPPGIILLTSARNCGAASRNLIFHFAYIRVKVHVAGAGEKCKAMRVC